MTNIEMHFHTKESSCTSWSSWNEIAEAIKQSDLDYFCITDHGSLTGYMYLKSNFPEIREKIFPGIEVTTPSHGDFLIYTQDLCFLNHLERNYNLKDLIKKLEEVQDPHAIIWAHPNSNPFYGTSQTIDLASQIASYLDGVEVYNGFQIAQGRSGFEYGLRIEEAKGRKIALIGGSDTHQRRSIKRAYTEFPSLNSPKEMLDFIKKGNCTPRFNEKENKAYLLLTSKNK
ncbi:PHP domain-containing protein [Candidatus Pacearchaeota archaeon]|nr:PHP domain-containing protein [Candidatus Pacearchaeota archaeon]